MLEVLLIKILFWFPSVFIIGVSFPLDEVFGGSVVSFPVIRDAFKFVLVLVCCRCEVPEYRYLVRGWFE